MGAVLQRMFATEPCWADEVVSYGKWEARYAGFVLTYEFFSNGYMAMRFGTDNIEGTTFPCLYKVTGTELEMYTVGVGGTINYSTVPISYDGTYLYIDGAECRKVE